MRIFEPAITSLRPQLQLRQNFNPQLRNGALQKPHPNWRILTIPQSALFNFNALLLVILLLICTCTYVREVVPGWINSRKDKSV